MKTLLIFLIVYIACISADGAKTLLESQVTNSSLHKKIKNGYLDIYLKTNRVILTIRKFDGTKMKNVLITKNSNKTNGEITMKNCIPSDSLITCILSDDIPFIKIKTDPSKEVVEINREIDDPRGEIRDCYQLVDDTQWYGGPQRSFQQWPMQNMHLALSPYTTNFVLVERYWLSSHGIYLFVSERDPLFVDQNNALAKHLCLIAMNQDPYPHRDKITLTYTIGVFEDVKSAHKNVISEKIKRPNEHPNPALVEHPIWSTWARYKVDVNESIVLDYAKEIKENGFKNSQIEIDDNWETCYGSAKFDPVKFPNVTRLVKQLKDLGFHVSLWSHPFINVECEESFKEAYEKGYFVKNENGSVIGSWWNDKNGTGSIDFTNKEAANWWIGRLKKIQELGIDTFKFDAGETYNLPQIPVLSGPIELQPGIYATDYLSTLAKQFDDRIEVRVGWKTQNLPIFVRMHDKSTSYSWNNGLPTLITSLFLMNLNGYVFVLPDMIGGNGNLPPKDLFIRWLQANVFMPSLQFSFAPWEYDNETIEISKKFTKLHAEIKPKIVELMKKAVASGEPINMPIWWVDPLNTEAHKINDEYLLGEEYLVAPVTEENAIERDIYLPAGKWRDANTDKLYAGPIWLEDYPAPLDTLPYFKKE